MKNSVKGLSILLLTSIIWGLTFVAQSKGAEVLGAFTFNAMRFILAFVLLLIIGLIFYLCKGKKEGKPFLSKKTIIAGLISGAFILVASSFQQIGVETTDAGKSGFITALYILFVPIFGLMFKKKTSWNVWVSVGIAIGGFYLLNFNGSFTLSKGDIMLLICAVMFAFQILAVDYFAKDIDAIMMSCIQFFVAGLGSLILMFIFDKNTIQDILTAKWSILYAGIFSCTIAYTLQIVGQKYAPPTIASLVMSLESIFAVLGGLIILKEVMSAKEYIGCALIFVAIIFCQIPFSSKKKDEEKTERTLQEELVEDQNHNNN